jgi:hypothetical protein
MHPLLYPVLIVIWILANVCPVNNVSAQAQYIIMNSLLFLVEHGLHENNGRAVEESWDQSDGKVRQDKSCHEVVNDPVLALSEQRISRNEDLVKITVVLDHIALIHEFKKGDNHAYVDQVEYQACNEANISPELGRPFQIPPSQIQAANELVRAKCLHQN